MEGAAEYVSVPLETYYAEEDGRVFQVREFEIYHSGKKLGVSKMWHTNAGAFMHFTDTQES